MTDTDRKPWLLNDPALADVLRALRKREPLFHRFSGPAHREDCENQIVTGFWEVGASGARYDIDVVAEAVERRSVEGAPDVWDISDFHCQELAPDLYLATYTLVQGQRGERRSRRATIWSGRGDDWRAVYHQGTLIQET